MQARRKSVSYAALKHCITISQVLNRYGLKFHRSGDNLNGTCPLHAGHNPTQFRVSLSKNLWICFGDCQVGGSVLDFVSRKEGVTIREAALLLQEWFGLSTAFTKAQGSIRPTTQKPPIVLPNRVLPLRLHRLTFHPYLAERGLHRETIDTFGLGYCSHGSMAGRIVIPIHNHEGKLVAYAGRWPGTPADKTPKYKLPLRFRKTLELFNFHHAITSRNESSLKVVEGFFGCMAVWQAGFHRVVGLMGSSISDEQKKLIIQAAGASKQVDLLFDEDNAGRVAREKARDALSGLLEVRVISLPEEGLQPDHISPQTLCALLA